MYKILIADDEQIEREALKAIINKGIDSIIEIQEAVNGREAIVKARTFNPDIIFLDIKMPGINGIEAARTIREDSKRVSIVFLTAFNQFEYAQEAIQIGVDDYIIKPSSESRVIEVVSKLTGKIDESLEEQNRKKDNELRLSRVTGYLENEFIYNMAVRGISQEKFDNYLSILDINFISARAGITNLLYDSYPIHVESRYQKQVLKKRTAFIIKSAAREYGFLTLFTMELSNIYFLLINKDGREAESTGDFRELTEAIAEGARKDLNLKVNTGIGNLFSSPSKSLKSFSEAKISLSGGKSGKTVKDTEDKEEAVPLEIEIALEEALLKGNREDTMGEFEKLKQWLDSSDSDTEQKKHLLTELCTVLRHAAAYQLPDGRCRIDCSELREAAETEQLMTEMNIFLNSLLEQILEAKETENSPAIIAACDFIDRNFQNDISLEDTASQCRLSSFYFSKLFKKYKGMTFIEYLTKRRIDEAKELLKEGILSVKEISGAVGYSDPNYFTRVFKRLESISPTAYRNKKMLKKQ